MIRAHVRVPTSSRSASKSIVASVQPDNLEMKGLVVKGKAMDRSVSFRMEFEGKIETFISTMDDLLRCLQAARETLEKIASRQVD